MKKSNIYKQRLGAKNKGSNSSDKPKHGKTPLSPEYRPTTKSGRLLSGGEIRDLIREVERT